MDYQAHEHRRIELESHAIDPGAESEMERFVTLWNFAASNTIYFYEKKTKNKKVADIIRFPLTTRLTNINESSANLMILVLELSPGWKGLSQGFFPGGN